jgi:uncharacterized protein (DUF849 family)
MQKLMIEVRLNERMMREEGNPNVPYVPEEIATDAVACRAAGASIVHFHARKADGSVESDPFVYARTIKLIKERCDVLIHPTLGGEYVTYDASDESRLAHILSLAKNPAEAPHFAPIDVGSANVDPYDPVTKSFQSGDLIYKNCTRTIDYFAQTMTKNHVKPILVCWGIGFLRHSQTLLERNFVSEPAYLYFILGGDNFIHTHPTTPKGLQAMVDFLPKGRVEWTVASYGGNLLKVAAAAISQGGHVAIGIGDYCYNELGQPTNADLVSEIVRIAKELGREVATPAETRKILNITAP